MLRQSIRSSKSLAISFALGVIAAVGAAGCSGSDTDADEPLTAPDVQSQRITAEDIADLAQDEYLSLDLTAQKKIYVVDYSDAPINYARIKLEHGAGAGVLLEEHVAVVENTDYGDHPQPDLRTNQDGRFRIATDPTYFGALSESQLDQLKANGFLLLSTDRSAAESGPQSIGDKCEHWVCDVCIDNRTGEKPAPDAWQPGTFTCYEVVHYSWGCKK